jgi:repressor LexA
MLLSDRLKNERNKQNISQMELSKAIGVSQQTIGSWETNRTKPDTEMIKKIANYFKVSIDYLLGNSELMYSNEVQLPSENKKIPIIGTVRCGPNGLAYEYVDGYIYVDSSLTGDIRAFHCKGDSMTGLGIFDGDIAVVRIQADVESGELAVVVINGDEGTLKRVRKHDDVLILEAANSVYPPRVFTGKELNTVKIVGKVIEVRKKF